LLIFILAKHKARETSADCPRAKKENSAMKQGKALYQMSIAELEQFRKLYENRTDHVAELMRARIDEAIEHLRKAGK
jgi:hypothetical protein